MRLKNKLRLNIAVVAFLAILVAGTAFAFASSNPLVFNGTVNVDARLIVGIDTDDVTYSIRGNHLRPPENRWLHAFSDFIPGHPTYAKTVELNAWLYGHEDTVVRFQVENLGTMAAFVDIDTWMVDNFPHVTVTHDWVPRVMAVGERVQVEFIINFDTASVTESIVNETVNFSLTLSYTHAMVN